MLTLSLTRVFLADFAPFVVKNPCRATARLRIFALNGTKSSQKSAYYFSVNTPYIHFILSLLQTHLWIRTQYKPQIKSVITNAMLSQYRYFTLHFLSSSVISKDTPKDKTNRSPILSSEYKLLLNIFSTQRVAHIKSIG